MRLTIDIPDDLLKRWLHLSLAASPQAAIEDGLRYAVRSRLQAELRALRGTLPSQHDRLNLEGDEADIHPAQTVADGLRCNPPRPSIQPNQPNQPSSNGSLSANALALESSRDADLPERPCPRR